MRVALEKKIASKKAKVGILGLGYVGLPLAMEFAEGGYSVLGFDIAPKRVQALNRGRSHIGDVPSKRVKAALAKKRFHATARFENLKAMDALIVCVPTPLRKTKEPDVSYILDAVRRIAKTLRKGQLVVLESTTYPGTTEDLVLPLLEETGLKAGRDFLLSFSPERVDPANPKYTIYNTPKVIGGVGEDATRLTCALYRPIVAEVVPVSCATSAEMVKLLENTFRAVNIGLINEFALKCHKLGLDVWEIIGAAKTKPFGFMSFQPGPGLGGHCIPVDPQYLAWKMRSLNFEPRFIELAGVVNGRMPEHVVERIGAILNESGLAIHGSRILLLGMAYKPDVADIRESPSLDVLKLLLERGAKVRYHDPFVEKFSFEGSVFRSKPLTPATLRGSELAVVLTAHASVDMAAVVKHSKRVFDTRNATRKFAHRKVEKL